MFKCCYQVGRNFPPEYVACDEPGAYSLSGTVLCLAHLEAVQMEVVRAANGPRILRPTS